MLCQGNILLFKALIYMQVLIFISLQSTGRDRSWTGDYAACGHCHLVHAA